MTSSSTSTQEDEILGHIALAEPRESQNQNFVLESESEDDKGGLEDVEIGVDTESSEMEERERRSVRRRRRRRKVMETNYLLA